LPPRAATLLALLPMRLAMPLAHSTSRQGPISPGILPSITSCANSPFYAYNSLTFVQVIFRSAGGIISSQLMRTRRKPWDCPTMPVIINRGFGLLLHYIFVLLKVPSCTMGPMDSRRTNSVRPSPHWIQIGKPQLAKGRAPAFWTFRRFVPLSIGLWLFLPFG
jgi:hypothetical protein